MLGAGKLTMVLGGTGQGAAELGDLGDGLPRPRTVGLARAGPAVASRRRRYEGIATLAILAVLTVVADARRRSGGRDGRALLRRDRPVGGRPRGRLDDLARPGRRRRAATPAGLIAIGIAIGCVALVVVVA